MSSLLPENPETPFKQTRPDQEPPLLPAEANLEPPSRPDPFEVLQDKNSSPRFEHLNGVSNQLHPRGTVPPPPDPLGGFREPENGSQSGTSEPGLGLDPSFSDYLGAPSLAPSFPGRGTPLPGRVLETATRVVGALQFLKGAPTPFNIAQAVFQPTAAGPADPFAAEQLRLIGSVRGKLEQKLSPIERKLKAALERVEQAYPGQKLEVIQQVDETGRNPTVLALRRGATIIPLMRGGIVLENLIQATSAANTAAPNRSTPAEAAQATRQEAARLKQQAEQSRTQAQATVTAAWSGPVVSHLLKPRYSYGPAAA